MGLEAPSVDSNLGPLLTKLCDLTESSKFSQSPVPPRKKTGIIFPAAPTGKSYVPGDRPVGYHLS